MIELLHLIIYKKGGHSKREIAALGSNPMHF